MLDHIYMSEELLMVRCYMDIINTLQYFRTDHRAVVNTICTLHIINLPSNARRKTRRKKNHSEDILDNKHNILTHWLLFKETSEENFRCSFAEDPACNANTAYGRIIDQVRSAAKVSLR